MEKLEAKLKAVDWAVRDVLVGTMRSLQQLDICRKDCFYYIPAERLQDSDFPVRYVALYSHSMCSAHRQVSGTTAKSRNAAPSAGARSQRSAPGEGRKETFITASTSGNGSS